MGTITRNLILLLFMVMMAASLKANAAVNCNTHKIYCQIKNNHPKIADKFAMQLSNIIYKNAKKYRIPADIYAAILMQESAYRVGAIAKACGLRKPSSVNEVCVIADFGMSQINYKTAKSYGFDIERLTTDIEYSVEAGAKVLSWFHRRYSEREHDWYCRYNVGTRPKHKIKTACETYLRMVRRYL